MDKEFARRILKEHGLRVTSPRLAVVMQLAQSELPLSCGEVLQKLGETDWDNATIYRNLIKLRDVGLAKVVSRVDGIDRYGFVTSDGSEHQHPHFACDQCGRLACLSEEVTMNVAGNDPWATSIQRAKVQLRGDCPDCLDR